MATRRPKHINSERVPTQLTISKNDFRESLRKRVSIGEEILNCQILTPEQLKEANQSKYDWDKYNSELLKQSFNNEHNEYKEEYDRINFFYGTFGDGSDSPLQQFKDKLKNKITNLRQLIESTDLLKSQISDSITFPVSSLTDMTNNKDVFIVHGHNTEIKITIARTLEKLGLNPIILHEQANEGKTIIEKFEAYSNVGFAIVLLTDDDLGQSKTQHALSPRARQNVVLELGYFFGKLGRNRVCPLYVPGVELPSDLYGLLYVEIDNPGYWKVQVAKELKAVGYDIDINKIM